MKAKKGLIVLFYFNWLFFWVKGILRCIWNYNNDELFTPLHDIALAKKKSNIDNLDKRKRHADFSLTSYTFPNRTDSLNTLKNHADSFYDVNCKYLSKIPVVHKQKMRIIVLWNRMLFLRMYMSVFTVMVSSLFFS